ncbi:MAG: T9SS type A sorting domain-containing protein [Sphingobacteriales bacterium]|nr:T9SS type A sorting domain-containing protein [Sphingobacteriales bacterium]
MLLPTRRQNAQVQLTDMQGRTLQSVSVPPDYSGRYFSISTQDLPNGAYLVSYTSEGKIVGTAKVVVQH